MTGNSCESRPTIHAFSFFGFRPLRNGSLFWNQVVFSEEAGRDTICLKTKPNSIEGESDACVDFQSSTLMIARIYSRPAYTRSSKSAPAVFDKPFP